MSNKGTLMTKEELDKYLDKALCCSSKLKSDSQVAFPVIASIYDHNKKKVAMYRIEYTTPTYYLLYVDKEFKELCEQT